MQVISSRGVNTRRVRRFAILSCVLTLSLSSPPYASPQTKRATAAERLQDRVYAIQNPLYAKCGKEGEVCGGTPEDVAQTLDAILRLLNERLTTSKDANELVMVADLAESFPLPCGNAECFQELENLRQRAAKKAVTLAPANAAANMAFAMSLWRDAQTHISNDTTSYYRARKNSQPNALTQSDLEDASRADEQIHAKYRPLFVEAERHALRAIELTAQPTWVDFSNLAQIEEELPTKAIVAYNAYRHALVVAQRNHDAIETKITLDSLWPLAFNLGNIREGKEYHRALADTGQLKDADWWIYARRLTDEKDYSEAADAYLHAASVADKEADKATYWGQAASFFYISDKSDDALAAARSALQLGDAADANTKADANRVISEILADRGLNDEALRHAEQAITAKPDDHRNQLSLGNALYGLRRYQDAIVALKEALRLSDGKFSSEHFLLGNVYFDMNLWNDAAKHFKLASDLDPTDSAATYNLALCFENQGYRSDAADWFRETLRRKPDHQKREQILKSIARLEAK